MSMGQPELTPNLNGPEHDHGAEEEEFEEISVEITDDNMVWMHGADWELLLSPTEARELGQALVETAAEAEAPEE
jgi:hypothetical protein